MSFKVITHNGKAHMDELLAIVLLSIYNNELPTEIKRINPEEAAELVKYGNKLKETYFIDCGLKYDPDDKVFDHHHSKEIGCSALLVFDYLFKDLRSTTLHKYIQLVSKVDTLGPNSLNDFTFQSESVEYFGFSQNLLLRQFEKSPLKVTDIFTDGILTMINFEETKNQAKQWLINNKNTVVKSIKNINALVYLKVPPPELASAVKILDGDIIREKNIHVTYSFDKDDNRVRTLYRTLNGDKLINFSTATVNNKVFCHPGGFLLKFIPETDIEWKSIIDEALIV